MSKDPKILLQHILESVDALREYVAGMSEEEFLSNMEKQDSAERRLQIVGEAIVQLPHEFKDKYPGIPWAKVAGLRNRLVHEYFDVDHKLVWNTIEKSMPEFKKQIETLLEEK